ncbi:hypothetical protein CO026_01575 [Candidatus Kaiserbacteria bacterium CG_4_9_14_0_2_um_filter_41_32]|uniref:SMP-30/Gluconolactonase/LRE-like region domain-containing protein n=1 Tax=Candidatus Kaiserbacteria bacterium CG_4_9_14_0_2_um_filter_41_32 TaxID=1974601 RepID=A0A2M8FEZ0_9BACT|nr:MAG: hypothetical protein CO026_01575 [Candidatus Kaiserbacteria bacterium CG_4_9_14_0_2_um_filter_41_32]
MKRSTFIIIGFIIIILLLAFWLYSLLYGTPQKVAEVFTNFGFGENSSVVEVVPVATTTVPEAPIVDVVTAKLRQLTTRPVIGFREFQATTTEPKFITYAEAGTGHIYTINLTSGEEIRVSNVTIPTAETAVFSASGRFVAVRSGFTNKNEVLLVDLNDLSSIKSEVLPYNIDNFTFSVTDELLFTEITTTGAQGRALNPSTKAIREIFTVPFQAITMVWSQDGVTPHYVYPKASSRLLGFLYAVSGDSIIRMPISGTGLTAKASADYIGFSQLVNLNQQSFVYNTKTGVVSSAPIMLTPEKCVFTHRNNATLYCGYEITDYPYTFPDDWYKGTKVFSDRIWSINFNTQSATQIISPPVSVGRELDITDMSIGLDDKMLYFTNKNDRTLWLYEI